MAKVAELSKLQLDWQLIVSVGAGSVCTTSFSRQTCFRLAFKTGLVRKCQWAFMPIEIIKLIATKMFRLTLGLVVAMTDHLRDALTSKSALSMTSRNSSLQRFPSLSSMLMS